jgi:hypothetical protein
MSRNRPVTENELEQEPKAQGRSSLNSSEISPTRRFLVILSPQGGVRKVTCFGVLFKERQTRSLWIERLSPCLIPKTSEHRIAFIVPAKL